MRHVLHLIAGLALLLGVCAPRAAAQSASATVQASATVVDPARAAVDAAGASVRTTGHQWLLSAPLRVQGAGSPTVVVGEGPCRVVPPAPGSQGAPRLRCRGPAAAPAGAQVPVTLLIIPAT
jgi:hypothetical protein